MNLSGSFSETYCNCCKSDSNLDFWSKHISFENKPETILFLEFSKIILEITKFYFRPWSQNIKKMRFPSYKTKVLIKTLLGKEKSCGTSYAFFKKITSLLIEKLSDLVTNNRNIVMKCWALLSKFRLARYRNAKRNPTFEALFSNPTKLENCLGYKFEMNIAYSTSVIYFMSQGKIQDNFLGCAAKIF